MLAVFERLDLSILEQILGAASEESSLQLVSFDLVQPEGAGTVPDGRIAASFKYLFEVKTVYAGLRREQLEGHLTKLDSSHGDERLFVVTPDAAEPSLIAELADERVRWMSFYRLSHAIDDALDDEAVGDDERFLLRELQTLFAEEGLLGREDTVVVAASFAYGYYLKQSAYVCQSGRAFRRDLSRMAFYSRRKIEPEIPTILLRRDDVTFSRDEITRLRSTNDEMDAVLAALIELSITNRVHPEDQSFQVFLLSSPDDKRTWKLPKPIRHEGDGRGSAWTMGQRYAYFDDLKAAPATTAELGRGASAR
jgi:hypothetical protein